VRLFVGVEIAGDVRESLGQTILQLRNRIGAVAPRARVSWTAPDKIHLTIRFIGEVSPETAESLCQVLGTPLDVDAFDLTVSGTGMFPTSGPPRVVWAGIADGLEPLARVEREVSSRLEKLGIARETRPYRPHLTLGRIRVPGGLRAPALLEGTSQKAFGITRVEETTLFESRLSDRGPTHVVLSRTRLR
jgi:2'-5' RNA ligase